MPKLRMPEDRKAICELIEDQLRGLASVDLPLAIPKQGDPRLVSHQLGLQGVVEDPSVRMGVNELIGNGKIVVSEPVWVDTQGSPDDSRVQYGRLA